MESNNSVLNGINKEIKIKLGKIKGIAEGLKAEIGQEKLDRNSCREMLVDLKLSLVDLKSFLGALLKTLIDHKSSLEEMHYLLSGVNKSCFERVTSTDLIIEGLRDWVSPKDKAENSSTLDLLILSTDSVIREIDSSSYFKDEDIRSDITKFAYYIDFSITALSDSLSLPLTGMAQLQELISIKSLGLDENWLVSICYLSAMEIIVNKKQKELNIKVEKDSFEARFKALLKNLESKGIKISELEKELPPTFWKIRNQVVHEGYSPTQDELDLIIPWVKKIIMLLLQV